MAKVAISGYYGFKNFGDEAILNVLVNHLKSIGCDDITVFSSDVAYTEKEYGVKAVKRFDIKNVISVLKSSDVLISGGGSLLQDVTSLKSLVYYSFIIALGILFNKKVIIFAQGIGPLNSCIAKLIVKNLLKYCTYVSVRDENSLNILKKFGVKADLVCDPIYSIEVKVPQCDGSIGIQLRDFRTMNYNLLQKLALLIITKFSDRKIKIFSLQKTQDYELSKKFETILKSFNSEINTEIIEDDIINNISRLEYLFAMRFHAVLVALKYGIKTCAINYDIKVEKLASDANIPMISMDASENLEYVYSKLERLEHSNLVQFVSSKIFAWSNFDNLI